MKITMGEGNVSNRVGGGNVEGGLAPDVRWGLGIPHICHILFGKKCINSQQKCSYNTTAISKFGTVGIWDDIFGILHGLLGI